MNLVSIHLSLSQVALRLETNMPQAAEETDDQAEAELPSKKKKKKKKKDKNAPKKPNSPYMFYMKGNRKRVKEENPNATFGELGRIIGEEWSKS